MYEILAENAERFIFLIFFDSSTMNQLHLSKHLIIFLIIWLQVYMIRKVTSGHTDWCFLTFLNLRHQFAMSDTLTINRHFYWSSHFSWKHLAIVIDIFLLMLQPGWLSFLNNALRFSLQGQVLHLKRLLAFFLIKR